MTDEPTERDQIPPPSVDDERRTPPHLSPAESSGQAVERPPRPSQAEGEREPGEQPG